MNCSTLDFLVLQYLLEFAQTHIHRVGDAIQPSHSLSCPSTALSLFQHQCVCMCAQSLSHVQLFATPQTVAHQALLSIEFSKQEYWSGLPFPSLGNLLHPVIKSLSLGSPALAGRFFTTSLPGRSQYQVLFFFFFPMSQFLASNG